MSNIYNGHFILFAPGIHLNTNKQSPQLICNNKIFWYNVEENKLYGMDYSHFLNVNTSLQNGIQKNAVYWCQYELKTAIFDKENDLVCAKKIVFHNYELKNSQIETKYVDKINEYLLNDIKNQLNENILLAKIIEAQSYNYVNKQKQGSLLKILVCNVNFSSLQMINYDNAANKKDTTNFIEKHKNFLIGKAMLFLNVFFDKKNQSYQWDSRSMFLNLENTFLKPHLQKILLNPGVKAIDLSRRNFTTLAQFNGTLTDLKNVVTHQKKSLEFETTVVFEVCMQPNTPCWVTHKCKLNLQEKWQKNNIVDTCVLCGRQVRNILQEESNNDCWAVFCIDGFAEYKNENYKTKIMGVNNLHKFGLLFGIHTNADVLKKKLSGGDELAYMHNIIDKKYSIHCKIGINANIASKHNLYFQINDIVQIKPISFVDNVNISDNLLDMFGLAYLKNKEKSIEVIEEEQKTENIHNNNNVETNNNNNQNSTVNNKHSNQTYVPDFVPDDFIIDTNDQPGININNNNNFAFPPLVANQTLPIVMNQEIENINNVKKNNNNDNFVPPPLVVDPSLPMMMNEQTQNINDAQWRDSMVNQLNEILASPKKRQPPTIIDLEQTPKKKRRFNKRRL